MNVWIAAELSTASARARDDNVNVSLRLGHRLWMAARGLLWTTGTRQRAPLSRRAKDVSSASNEAIRAEQAAPMRGRHHRQPPATSTLSVNSTSVWSLTGT